MKKKNLRDSTNEKSELLKEKLRERELESKRRKSHKLIRLAEKESALINEALELSVYNQEESSNSDIEQQTDTSAKDTTSGDNTSEPTGSQEDPYWYDTSNTELTGHQELPVTPSTATNLEPDSWSPLNRFFPEGCVRSPPIVLNSKAASVPTSAPPLIQSSSFTHFGADLDNSDSASAHSNSIPSPTLTVIMAIETFKSKFKEIKKLAANLDLQIDCYNEDTITLLDRDHYMAELKKIYDTLVTLQGKVFDFQESLNEDIDEQKNLFDDAATLFGNSKTKVVQNATAVKRQIQKLIDESDSSKSSSTADADKKKLTLKVTNATTKFTSLKEEVAKLADVKDMGDNTIRESMNASKEWKKELKVFASLKEALDIDLVTISIENDLTMKFQQEYKETVELVSKKIEELTLADKNLGLYSLADIKNKSTVQYPDSFTGSLGENVFKFIKEFKEAIEADQIRKADEVKMLIKYLKGDAKHTIGENHISLKNALKQ